MTSAAETPFAGFGERLRWREDACDGGVALAPALAAFHAASGGPWRAACSLWGQIYFNALLIPATGLLTAGWRDDAFALSLAPACCPNTGAPLWIDVHGERRPAAQAERAFLERVETHLDRTIGELAAAGRLSKRMLEEGAELSLRWAAAQIGPDGAKRLRSLAERAGPRLARGWTAGLNREGATRRYCCLRYQLDGGVRCVGVCPRRES